MLCLEKKKSTSPILNQIFSDVDGCRQIWDMKALRLRVKRTFRRTIQLSPVLDFAFDYALCTKMNNTNSTVLSLVISV